MNPERRRKVMETFEASLAREPHQRALFLADACHGDEELRREVQSLLASHEQADNFNEERASTKKTSALAVGQDNLQGRGLEGFKGTKRFLIQRRLGAGGFGVVYQAYDTERNSVVALKVLSQSDPDSLYRFKREFRALADITHPNLVSLYELMSDGENWFFTMELVEGVNFLDHVRESPNEAPKSYSEERWMLSTLAIVDSEATQGAETNPHHPEEVKAEEQSAITPSKDAHLDERIFDANPLRAALIQLTNGLRALHAAGKLHRDIKPSNVLVTPEGRVVILDFGLITELASLDARQSMTIAGTPAYMSPEQGSGLPVTEASDWYCVGVMLYEALAGHLPFVGRYNEILRDKQLMDPPAPSELMPGIPEDLNALCRDLLRRDPQSRPSGSEILLRLGKAQARKSEVVPQAKQVAPFVGREGHLKALEDAFMAMKRGRVVAMYLHGRSGMGKSALIRQFLDDLRQKEREVVILAGRCYEQESVPFKALDSLIDELSRYLKRLPPITVEALVPRDVLALARLFPVLRQVEAVARARRRVLDIPDSQELRRRAFAALRELLSRLADQKLLVLCIDDLQWGDVDSIALISELLRPPDPPSLFIIAGYRAEDAETSPPLQMLSQLRASGNASVDFRDLEVTELSPLEAESLARIMLGESQSISVTQAEKIAREAESSPIFIQELVMYLQDRHNKGQQSDEGAEGIAHLVTLDEVIWTRVSQLPQQARQFLEVIAVAGRPIPLDVAKTTTKLDTVDHQILSVLRSERLIKIRETQDVDEIETYHDRYRETIVNHLSPAELKAYHHQLAFSLEAYGQADLETLAVHFQEAGLNDKAADYASAAASQSSEALAFDRAARLYRLAIQLRSANDDETKILRRKLGEALVNAGRGAEAAEVYIAAAGDTAGVDKLEMQRCAAEQFLRSGRIDEGIKVLRTILSAVGMNLPETPRQSRPSLLLRRIQVRLRGLRFNEKDAASIPPEELIKTDICWSAAIGLSTVDTVRGADFQSRHLLLALRAGEIYRVARALATEAGYSSTGGGRSVKRTQTLLDLANKYAEKTNHPHALGITTLASGLAAFFTGRWKSSVELMDRGEIILRERCKGVAWELNMAHFYALVALVYMGEMAEIVRRLPTILNSAKERGDFWATTNLQALISYLMYLIADETDQARHEVSQAIKRWSQQGFYNQHWWGLLARGEIALYCEEGKEAWQLITEHFPSVERSLIMYPQVSLISAMRLRARCALIAAKNQSDAQTRQRLLQSAKRDAKRIERENMAWGNALALLIRAGVAATEEDTETAISLLTSAENNLRANDMALFANVAYRRHGELVGGIQGKSMIEAADAWMQRQKIKNPASISAMLAPGRWS